MSSQLTPKQEIVLKAIQKQVSRTGEAPTLRELLEAVSPKMKLASLNSIVQYLGALEEKGYIQKFSKIRGIRLIEEKIGNFFPIPLLGNADCGEPLSYAEDRAEDYINISEKFLKGIPQEYFFVKASGTSMDKEGIHDGDFVLVRKNDAPEDGKNVVAVINGLGTIKKLHKSGSSIKLMPSSTDAKHKPIFLHPSDNILICGQVERVFN
jgi:repressor LexA